MLPNPYFHRQRVSKIVTVVIVLNLSMMVTKTNKHCSLWMGKGHSKTPLERRGCEAGGGGGMHIKVNQACRIFPINSESRQFPQDRSFLASLVQD